MVEYYMIDNRDGLAWNLYHNNDAWDDITHAGISLCCMKMVKKVFDNVFGSVYVNSVNRIAVMLTKDTPICYRENGLIFLTSTGDYPPQVVFQFAHELCHLMFPIRGTGKHGWLVETICHIASMYCLTYLENEVPKNHLLAAYNLITYRDLNTESEEVLVPSLLQYRIDNKLVMEADSTIRSKNNVFAKALFPLFWDVPCSWRTIPYLFLPDSLSFEECMNKWKNDVPRELQCVVEKITGIIC